MRTPALSLAAARRLAALALPLLLACTRADETTPTVGLITKTASNPFFVKMKEGAEQAAAAQGATLIAAAGRSDGDNAGQVTAIENLVAAGAQAILISVSDAKAIVPAIKKARDAGILVVALDSPTDPLDATDALFATDNYRAGLLIGQYAKARIGTAPARIATLDLIPGNPTGAQRHNGFLAGFGLPSYENTRNELAQPPEVVCMADAMGDQAKGQTAMENCLQAHPDINVVYAVNEPSAAGAFIALQQAGKEKGVVLVSVDGSCRGVRSVADGSLTATAQQYPQRMAELGVQAAMAFITAGTKASGYVDTGVQLIAKDSVPGVASLSARKALDLCWGDK
jgi:fructose transport system substrate-binding protein